MIGQGGLQLVVPDPHEGWMVCGQETPLCCIVSPNALPIANHGS